MTILTLRDAGLVGNGVLWTPAAISTSLWLDAADASTVTTVSGAVSQWNDKSGNNRNASQSTPGNRPAYTTTTQNGLNVLTFDGINDHLIHAFNGSPAPHSVFAVAQRTAGGSLYQVIINAIQPYSQFGVNISAKASGSNNWGSYINSWNFTSYTLLDTWRVIGVVSPASTSGSDIYITDGDVQTYSYSSRYPGDATNRLAIGGDIAFNDGWLCGKIGEIIIIMSAVSVNIRQSIEGYLAWKWGLTANLPSNHPYKTTPPLA